MGEIVTPVNLRSQPVSQGQGVGLIRQRICLHDKEFAAAARYLLYSSNCLPDKQFTQACSFFASGVKIPFCTNTPLLARLFLSAWFCEDGLIIRERRLLPLLSIFRIYLPAPAYENNRTRVHTG